jgi:hypothetical protein
VSIVVNLILDEANALIGIEDAQTGQQIQVGKFLDIEDGCRALQLRVLDFHGRHEMDEDICPSCLRVIPPPPPDLTWKRSLP